MALIHQVKNCKVCSKPFSPKKGVSYRQWGKSCWCSRGCFNSTRIGTHQSESHRMAIALGNLGRVFTQETRDKIALSNKGKTLTHEVRRKISLAKLGRPIASKGKQKLKMQGPNHWNWKEDRTKIKVGDRSLNDPLQKQWTRGVKNRDGWKCMISDGNCCGNLEAHHILPWAEYPELRFELKNGITLCQYHHPKRKQEVVRLAPVFQGMVNNFAIN